MLPSYVKLVRDAVSTSRDKERRKKKVRSTLDDCIRLMLLFCKSQSLCSLDMCSLDMLLWMVNSSECVI